jgi:hypothetical protein
MTFRQVIYVLYKKNPFFDGVIDVSSMIQVDQGITFAWSNICVSTRHETKTKIQKKGHGFLKTNPNCLCFREEKVGKCCGLMKSEVKPAKQIVKNGKILNFYASFRIRKVFDWSVGNSYMLMA